MKTVFPILACIFGLIACSPPPSEQPPASAPEKPDATPAAERSSIGPNGTILLVPGRTLTIAGGLEGPPTFVSEGPAGLNPFATAAAIHTESVSKTPARGKVPPDGQTTFSLWVAANGYTTLSVLNGHRVPMVYVTLLDRPEEGGVQTIPTATCAVNPRSGGIEDRANPVSAVRIVGMIAVRDQDLCYDPETEKTYKVGAR